MHPLCLASTADEIPNIVTIVTILSFKTRYPQ